MTLPDAAGAQTLLFDADDTLWENNVYFERAIAAFISYLDHRVHTAEEVRERLNLCERATIAEHGYGVKSFRRSLVACFEALSEEPLDGEKHTRIEAFTQAIATQEVELLPNVREVLARLAERHRLLLVTKGDPEEQLGKLQRSGLAPLFSAVEVPPEKSVAMYRGLIPKYQLIEQQTWMIGNSPRSDINPALEAGIHAIYIPHASTWVLEHDVIAGAKPGQRLIELERFAQLLEYF